LFMKVEFVSFIVAVYRAVTSFDKYKTGELKFENTSRIVVLRISMLQLEPSKIIELTM
jgi:hypothetical protein